MLFKNQQEDDRSISILLCRIIFSLIDSKIYICIYVQWLVKVFEIGDLRIFLNFDKNVTFDAKPKLQAFLLKLSMLPTHVFLSYDIHQDKRIIMA